MAARSTRQEARARILSAFGAQSDRVIPEDESVPLKGATFADFEDQVETSAQAALALNEDWGTHLDGKQIQRWAEAIGRTVTLTRDAEVHAFEQGIRPATPANAPVLLVIGMTAKRLCRRRSRANP